MPGTRTVVVQLENRRVKKQKIWVRRQRPADCSCLASFRVMLRTCSLEIFNPFETPCAVETVRVHSPIWPGLNASLAIAV